MADDFIRLVSSANPAARQQYQPANNGYPPSASYSDQSPNLMDPFFDDEEDNVPDSAFGNAVPMRSQESNLPLSRNAAPPAGTDPSSSSQGLPQGWNFDDDDFIPGNRQNFSETSNLPVPSKPKPKSALSQFKSQKWKWPWQKERVLTGERVITLNNSAANDEFCSNFVSTSKYSLLTFLPKFLFGMFIPDSEGFFMMRYSEQFSKYANLFFLFTACIQQIPGVSPTNRYTTIAPLAAVLIVSAFKEVQEDLACSISLYVSAFPHQEFRNDINLIVN